MSPRQDELQLHDRVWHELASTEVAQTLGTDLDDGLPPGEAAARLEQYGLNVISKRRGKGPLRRLLEQFTQSLVVILIVAGAVTAFLRHWVDSGVIFGVVVINATVGFFQESKAIQAIEALNKAMTTEATVVRAGVRTRISAEQLVPGDLVVLQSGDKVPADMRLTYSRDLQVDESALTGESLPVEKRTDPLGREIVLADRTNMVYASTLCSRGQGAGVVIATGDATEVGNISHLIAEAQQLQTPLTRKIGQFSHLLLFIILGLAALTAVAGVIQGMSAVDVFLAAVALAVGAIPEGLPAAVTIVLSIGVSRMARRRAIIRRLPAVETLGSTTVICSDKTGTLTENQMTVQQVVMDSVSYPVTGVGYAPEGKVLDPEGTEPLDLADPANASLFELLRAGLLCNDSSLYSEQGAWHITGDPTEGALLVSAAKAGVSQEEESHGLLRLDTLPFESEFQYMATLHAMPDGGRMIYVKGALERLLPRSTSFLNAAGEMLPLDAEEIEEQAKEMAARGLRVLAFARKPMPAKTEDLTHEHIDEGLVFLGLQGMIDPPRQEAINAIEVCYGAGVEVKMITGDHALTAKAIAHQLGLRKAGCEFDPELQVLTGSELEAVPDSDFADVAENTMVFARVTPEQKIRLVTALQTRGHVVAMTGDGVNDGPALRQANIGVAMGITGTEVAKEAADMVLTDDNFATIEAAVEEGRGVFDNLTKFITWTLPTNVAEGLVILVAVFIGTTLPILPVQILWINMTTAIALGATLAFEAKERGIMLRFPRSPRAPILDRVLIGRIAIVGGMLVAGVFGLFEYAQALGYSLEKARAVAVNVIVFGELAFLFNCRSLTLPSWKVGFNANRLLFAGVFLMIALQMIFTYVPVMNTVFGTAPISVGVWGWIILVAVVIHLTVELEKWIRRRRARRPGQTNVC
jgi:cation-transporting P-type ATPase F